MTIDSERTDPFDATRDGRGSCVRLGAIVAIARALGLAALALACQRPVETAPSTLAAPRWAGAGSRDDAGQPLPDPLRLADVVRLARRGRAEVIAAHEQARAASFRPAQVSALEDPMIVGSIDHLPLSLVGVNATVMVEQSFPLSRVRRHRERAAQAEARRLIAMAERVGLDVELEAVTALLMVHQARRLREVVTGQQTLAGQLVAAASARYAASQGDQPDVLRAETEVARLDAEQRALGSEIASAEAMLRASLGRPPEEPVPALALGVEVSDPPSVANAIDRARSHRPELAAMREQIAQAHADVDVMKSMYAPMARIGVGGAYTMGDGEGVMVLVGLSLPIWRGRLSAGVSEAEAMERMAGAELVAMARMVEGEVASAHASVEAAIIRVRTLREDVIPRARQTVDASLASYGAARTPLVTVIDATQALWDIEAELVREEAMLELSRARLRRAMGEEEAR